VAQPATFWNRIAKMYANKPIEDEVAYRNKLAKTQEYFKPDSEILEFGCGSGSTAIYHAPRVKHIRAIDISPRMLEIAKERATSANVDNITFECATLEEINAPDESFDVVMAMSILHLLENREATLVRVHRMLKPGGAFVSSTACVGDGKRLLKLIAPIGQFLGFLPLVQFFTPAELVQDIENAGFRIDYQWQPGKDKAVFIVALKP
jgi:ubiquinone/menaquinone biosynthesis C-methylase UbiE